MCLQIEMTADKQQALEAMLLQKMAGGETAWQPSLSHLLDNIEASPLLLCLGQVMHLSIVHATHPSSVVRNDIEARPLLPGLVQDH